MKQDNYQSMAPHSKSEGALRKSEVLSYGMADFTQTAAVQFTSMYLLFFYTDVLAVSAAIVGTIFVFSRLWDAINDPIMGVIVDRTQTRFGKCRPYLIPGSLILCLALILAYTKLPLEGAAMLIFVIVTYNLFNMAYTATNLPLTAQLPLMTNSLDERVKLSATRAFFQALAYALLPLAAEPLLLAFGGHRESIAYTSIAAILGVLCVLTFVFAFRNTQERCPVAPEKLNTKAARHILFGQSDWVVLLLANVLLSIALIARVSSAIYQFTYVVNDMRWFAIFMTVSTLAMVPCSLAAGPVARRIGKRNFALSGCVIGAIGNVWILLTPHDPIGLVAGGALAGCAVGAFISVLFAMEGDIADRARSRTGIDAQGIVCSVVALGYKIALGIGAGIVGWLLGSAGYIANEQQQTQAVLDAIVMAFAWVPLMTVIFAALVLLAYPTDR
ncbi:MAG: glycoside-pentoside-hexuronide (GPH):cation symporter [Pseudomonadota bacterium]